MDHASPSTNDLIEHRVRSAVRVAGLYRTGIEVEQLPTLLPEDGPRSGPEMATWLESHPSAGTMVENVVFFDPTHAAFGDRRERRQRAEETLATARWYVAICLRGIHPLIASVAVTGSVAYGDPQAQDDCDLFLITRRGMLWPALAYSTAVAQVRRRTVYGRQSPTWCVSYAMDETAAHEEFSRPRGFLFAREALSARPIFGEPRYARLIRGAPWLAEEAPRLFESWKASSGGDDEALLSRPSWAARLLNLFFYGTMATYLHAGRLRANRRARKSGRLQDEYRLVTRPDRMAVMTRKYDEIAGHYERPA